MSIKFILFKVAKDVHPDSLTQEGEVSYLYSDNSQIASRFGGSISYTDNKNEAKRFTKSKAKELAKKYNLKIRQVNKEPIMKVKVTDSGRSESKRPKAKNDCFPRAIANALDMDYDEAYDLAREFGFEGHRGLPVKKCKEFKNATQLGDYKMEWIYLPPTKGEERPNTHTIGKMFPEGRYILREAGHYSALVDGVLYDINDRSEEYPHCVYGVFKIIE